MYFCLGHVAMSVVMHIGTAQLPVLLLDTWVNSKNFIKDNLLEAIVLYQCVLLNTHKIQKYCIRVTRSSLGG